MMDPQTHSPSAWDSVALELLAALKKVSDWLTADNAKAPLREFEAALAKGWASGAFGADVFLAIAKAEALPQSAPGGERGQSEPAPVSGISLAVAKALVSLFGGEETDMSIVFLRDGHSGPGFYAWCTEYPEDGSDYLGPPSEYSPLSAIRSFHPAAQGDADHG